MNYLWFYLSKILPLFVLPVGVILLVLVLGVLQKRRWLVVTGVGLLWVSSTPAVGNALMHWVEGDAIRIPATEAATADAIVVLSGGRVTAPGPARVSEWGDPDRFFGGVELFQSGKAPVLVFTGGWTPTAAAAALEGDILKRLAISMSVPADRILTTGPVTNTAEEAGAVAAILLAPPAPRRRILLVTSAFHMSRAQSLFRAAGFDVAPFPVDFSTPGDLSVGVLDVFPSASAMSKAQNALREIYGRLFLQIVQ